ncbi:MAG: hypothetical protein KIH69_010825, partial [Anaerolineae bacterium]|nr:hypothetical protein [Anaerolineae bacterium]
MNTLDRANRALLALALGATLMGCARPTPTAQTPDTTPEARSALDTLIQRVLPAPGPSATLRPPPAPSPTPVP